MTVLDALEQAIIAGLPTLPRCPDHGAVLVLVVQPDGSSAQDCEVCAELRMWARRIRRRHEARP